MLNDSKVTLHIIYYFNIRDTYTICYIHPYGYYNITTNILKKYDM